MTPASRAALAALLLVACKAAPSAIETSSSAPTKASTPAVSVAASPPSPPSAPAPSAASAPTASAVASAAPGSPCAENARKDLDARYCISLPAKRLAVSFEGDSPAKGIREELEIAGDRVVITVGPVPAGRTVASMKEAALKRIGASLVESGDLERGYWTDLASKKGEHIVEGVVVSTYVITCTYWVGEKNLEAARTVCKSLKTF